MGYFPLIALVVVFHYLFVISAVFGGLLVAKYPRLAWAHAPLFLWAGFIVISPWPCPLTLLENWLRVRQGMPQYNGGFMAHYVHAQIRSVGFGWLVPYLGYFVLTLNAIIYLLIFVRHARRKMPLKADSNRTID